VRAADDRSPIPVGAELTVDDQVQAGVVTSVAVHPAGGQVGLAYVKRSFVGAEGAEARWEGGATPVTLHAPPGP
jgi:hypothetical protein